MNTTREFLMEVLSQGATAQHVSKLIDDRVGEDLHLDFKAGSGLLEGGKLPKGANPAALRQYVAGFANSAGGVLAVGIEEPPKSPPHAKRPVDGIPPSLRSGVETRVDDCLADLAPYLSTPPVRYVVAHPDGDVLLIAAERSDRLVPRIESGGIVYYLRMGHQTLPAPAYLVEDLFLHRRARPYLVPAVTVTAHETDADGLRFDLRVTVRNDSLVWADQPRVGVIAWSTLGDAEFALTMPPPLAARISTRAPLSARARLFREDDYRRAETLLFSLHAPLMPPMDLGPFEEFHGTLPIGLLRDPSSHVTRAALYTVARNQPAEWYPITIGYEGGTVAFNDHRPTRSGPNERLEVSWLAT